MNKHVRMRQQLQKLLGVFAAVFPSGVFDLKNPKPLGCGAFEVLKTQFPDIDVKLLKRFLAWWCTRKRYLKAVAAPRSVRCDLKGIPIDDVLPEHRTLAVKRLRELKARYDKMKKHKTCPAKKTTSRH